MFNFFQKIKPKYLLYWALFFEFFNLAYYFFFFKKNHYLPSPFVVDKNDTFMDFYNPLYWVIKDGFYTTFNSIYPALNYFILKFFTGGVVSEEVLNAFQLRNENSELTIFVLTVYIAILYLAVNLGEWKKFSFGTRALVFVACLCSTPVLFAFERGNLIFFALLFMALYLNASKGAAKSFYLALLINIKPYFIILLVQYINNIKLNWKTCFFTGIFSILIFSILGLWVGVDFINFFKAYIVFSKPSSISAEGIFSLPNSLGALARGRTLFGENSIFGYTSSFAFWFSTLKVINHLTVAALLAICVFKKISQKELLISAIVILTNFSSSTSGYILLAYIPLIAYLIDDADYKIILFFVVAIFTLPIDWVLILKVPYSGIVSYLGGNLTINHGNFYFGLGSIVRPILNYFIMISMISILFRKYIKFGQIDL